MNNLSLVDLKGVSEPIVKLIDCISSAAGVLYEPTRIRRKADATAYETLVKAKTEGIISDLELRTIYRMLEKETKRQLNIEEIVKQAADFAPEQSTSDKKPEDEWLTDFFDLCQNASSEKMQSLWARLLSGEVDQPGSFSRRTMQSIKLMSVEEANLYTQVCGCVWKISEESLGTGYAVILDTDEKGRYSDETWGFDGSKITLLESLNLAEYRFFDFDIRKNYSIEFNGENYPILLSNDNERLEIFDLSPIGVELYPICGHSPNLEYYNTTVEYMARRSLILDD